MDETRSQSSAGSGSTFAAGEDDIEQMIKKFPPFFYRRHLDVIKSMKQNRNVYTYTLTEYGLAMAFELVRAENQDISDNMKLIMDYDVAEESLRAQIGNPRIDAQRSIIAAQNQLINEYKSENAGAEIIDRLVALRLQTEDVLKELENFELKKNFPELAQRLDNAAGQNQSLFSAQTEDEIRATVSGECPEPTAYIIHRDGHTVTLFRQGDVFMLCDSYNAFGAKDADHLPILRMIREEADKLGRNVKIYTEHDKIQRDYDNCRIFSLETAVLTLNYLKDNNNSLNDLNDLIEETKQKVGISVEIPKTNTPKYESEYKIKVDEYQKLNVEAIPTLLTIIPLIQSCSQIQKITKNVDNDWIRYIGEQLYNGNKIDTQEMRGGYSYQDLSRDLSIEGKIKKTDKSKNETISSEAKRILEKLQKEYLTRTGNDELIDKTEYEHDRIDKIFQKASSDYINVMKELKKNAERRNNGGASEK